MSLKLHLVKQHSLELPHLSPSSSPKLGIQIAAGGSCLSFWKRGSHLWCWPRCPDLLSTMPPFQGWNIPSPPTPPQLWPSLSGLQSGIFWLRALWFEVVLIMIKYWQAWIVKSPILSEFTCTVTPHVVCSINVCEAGGCWISCHGFSCFDHSYIMLLVAGCCETWTHAHTHSLCQLMLLTTPTSLSFLKESSLRTNNSSFHIILLFFPFITLSLSLLITLSFLFHCFPQVPLPFSFIVTTRSPLLPQFSFDSLYLSSVNAVLISTRPLSYLHIS